MRFAASHRGVFLSALVGLALTAVGPAARADEIASFAASKSEGSFSHDVYVSYDGGTRLQQADVTFTITYEDGSKRTEKRFYGLWNTSARQTVNFSNNSEGSIQQVDLDGVALDATGKAVTLRTGFLFSSRGAEAVADRTATKAGAAPLQARKFLVTKSEGYFSHNVNLTNDGDARLQRVAANVTITFEDGTKRQLRRYFGLWNTGFHQVVNVRNGSEGTIQQVDVDGTAQDASGQPIALRATHLFASR